MEERKKYSAFGELETTDHMKNCPEIEEEHNDMNLQMVQKAKKKCDRRKRKEVREITTFNIQRNS